MYCPTCGADVPESKFCQNCGSPLDFGAAPEAPVASNQPVGQVPFANQPFDASRAAGTVQAPEMGQTPYAGQPSQAGQVPYPNQGAYASQTSPSNIAPNTAFVLAIVGLVFGLLGFSLLTIIPGIICCIIGLVLNSRYNRDGLYNPHKTPTTVMSVIGLVSAALSIVFFISVGAASVWFLNEYGDEITDADIEEMIEDFDNGGDSVSGSSLNSALASTAAGAANYDSRTFDKRGNVTLYALSEMSGEEISDALQARGYVWEESAQAWMASSGAAFEVQDNGGMMSRDAIERIDAGAAGDSVAFAALVVGYDTPAAALDALSGDVKIKDTCADAEGSIVFAIIEGNDGDERLAAVSETGKKQHMIFLFTEDAIEDGLFSQITGVNHGKSIEGVWKALNAK